MSREYKFNQKKLKNLEKISIITNVYFMKPAQRHKTKKSSNTQKHNTKQTKQKQYDGRNNMKEILG